MTPKEISDKFGYSEDRIRKNFPKTAAAIEKKFNVKVIRITTKEETFYQIIENNRALTLYDQPVELILLEQESLSLQSFQFFVFLAIVMMPQGVFRGTQKDFLRYMGVKTTPANLKMLKLALDSLVQKEYIFYNIDNEFIILYVRRRIEKQLWIDINMIRECKKIIQENHKHICKLPQLLQVWSAVRICEENQPFTYKDVMKLTGLSKKQIFDVKKLLENNQIFKTKRENSRYKCLGMNVDLNGFFNQRADS